MAKIEELEATIACLESRLEEESDRVITTITQHVDKSLDERQVGGEGYGLTKTVLEKIDLLIEQSKRAYEERVANAAQPDVENDDDFGVNIVEPMEEEDDVEISVEEEQVLIKQARDSAVKKKTKQLLEQRKKKGIYSGLVNGKFNPLVKTWRYPAMNLLQMITIWLIGVPSQHVPPLKHIARVRSLSTLLPTCSFCLIGT